MFQDDDTVQTYPVGDELVLSPSIMGKYGRPDISLSTLSYADAIALLAVMVTEKCSHMVDFSLEDPELQKAVEVTRVDVGTMIVYALDRYCRDYNLDVEDVGSFDYLRPYWNEVLTEMGFEIYQDYSHRRLKELTAYAMTFMPSGLELTSDDQLWVCHRLNEALTRKFPPSQIDVEILELSAHRAAVVTFYAEQYPILHDAVSNVAPLYTEDTAITIKGADLLSTRAKLLHNLLTVISFTA